VTDLLAAIFVAFNYVFITSVPRPQSSVLQLATA